MKRRVIELEEYKPLRLDEGELDRTDADALWRLYGGSRIGIEYPTPKTDDQWELTSLGWVGYIPLTSGFHLNLQSKVPLDNIFGMLEYAYNLKSFEVLEGVHDCRSLDQVFEKLAHVLAKRVLDRARQGFYREYLHRNERLSYLRGRMEIRSLASRPWDIQLQCRYEEHTPDIDDNQILAWTLYRISRSSACGERSLNTIRRAYRSLSGLVLLRPHPSASCLGRLYHRLNEDYRPLHALCRFFLENAGPTHQVGDQETIPFLLNMNSLFELFVARWLQAHPPEGLKVKVQHSIPLNDDGSLRFTVDIVLVDERSGEPVCVIDTKYKAPEGPATDDVQQVIAYAETLGCREAVLLYPIELKQPYHGRPQRSDIRVRTLAFPLEGDFEEAGRELLAHLRS